MTLDDKRKAVCSMNEALDSSDDDTFYLQTLQVFNEYDKGGGKNSCFIFGISIGLNVGLTTSIIMLLTISPY